ncbi:MAG: hypothetical protein KJO13_06450 [Gammaproteobacteria bacterium]|nr:hypothetical protein [Gammaproteobacteria bacterium]
MRQNRYIGLDSGKPPNVFVQAIAAVAAFGIFVISVIVGGIVLAGLVGLVSLAVIVIYARVWWLRRQIDRAMREQGRQADGGSSEEVVEAEYRVIDITDEDDSARR